MPGTLDVLVIMLAHLAMSLVVLVATIFLARRCGHRLKSVSWSLRGYTAEFHESVEPQSGNN